MDVPDGFTSKMSIMKPELGRESRAWERKVEARERYGARREEMESGSESERVNEGERSVKSTHGSRGVKRKSQRVSYAK
jgi:hypothetical protein